MTPTTSKMTFVKGHKQNLGRKQTPEIKAKISASKKAQKNTAWNKGTKGIVKAWNKGKPALWTSLRNKVANRLRKGNKHWNWKGGISKERHLLMGQLEYKQWRSDVFKRDDWTCQTCQCRGKYLEAHHIKRWSEYPELRYELSNGVTLCRECHNLTK